MIWSVLKIAVFVVGIALLAFGANFVIENGSDVQISAFGWEFTLSPFATIILAIIALFTLWIVLKLGGLAFATFHFLNGDETAISRYFDRNRERRGFEALADGMMALASGEPKLALTKAQRAEKFLNRPELTVLLSAQAAEKSGDQTRALGYYKQLLGEDRTRFVGIQGIMKQKLAQGETDTALALAKKAFALKPRHEGTLDTLFGLQSAGEDWTGARKTLDAKKRAALLPSDVHTRRDAVLALAQARTDDDAASSDALAIEANKRVPGLVPAAVKASQAYLRKGTKRNASRILKKAWVLNPHPELAAAYAAIEPDETPAARLKRFQPWISSKSDHPEAIMLSAELFLLVEDFTGAGKAVKPLVDDNASARVLTIMAAVDRGRGADDRVVRGWLAKAVGASSDPHWVCDNCNHIHGQWGPVCDNCAAFDTLAWQSPPAVSGATQGSEILPLIVGPNQIDDITDAVEADPLPVDFVHPDQETREDDAEKG
jgi:HemY protein